MKRILSYFRPFILLLLFPIKVFWFFCIKPICKYVVRDDIKYQEDRYEDLLRKYREKCKDINDISEVIKRLSKKLNRLETVFEYYKGYRLENSFTEKNEIVFIFSSKQKELDSYYLCGINGSHESNDCRIYLESYLDNLKIVDIISNTKEQGYARTLLEFTIKKAKESEIKEIYGDLSSVDSDSFDWLIPFYESLGFECTIFNDISAKMYGKMKLVTTADNDSLAIVGLIDDSSIHPHNNRLS